SMDRSQGERAWPRGGDGPARGGGIRGPQQAPYRQDPASFGGSPDRRRDRRHRGEDQGVPPAGGPPPPRRTGDAREGSYSPVPQRHERARGFGGSAESTLTPPERVV